MDDGHAITDALSVEAAPGHSPGHVVLKVMERDRRAVFCGDVIHHALQVYAPHWHHFADEDPAQAAVTRRRLLETCAEQKSLLFPIHFGAPHVARIEFESGGFSPKFVRRDSVNPANA